MKPRVKQRKRRKVGKKSTYWMDVAGNSWHWLVWQEEAERELKSTLWEVTGFNRLADFTSPTAT